ncbi:uncharacterized protein BDV14DRAFT_205760 [Aspergillus stella-maris]|uniref:uncharacterized protein n=1 Tax=Aspergillus stella-maris TaxID=1810926 RepID=UPI003CCDF6CB
MPALTLHLLSLTNTTTQSFISDLRKSTSTEVVVASRPRRVIISPTVLDTKTLLSEPWDLLLLLQPTSNAQEQTSPFPSELSDKIKKEYKIPVGIPSKLLGTYPQRDAELKNSASEIPLTGSLAKLGSDAGTGQNLEVSGELYDFMNEFSKVHDRPVTMLNLLHFHAEGGKQNYYKYGQGFNPIAARRGGSAKLVGNVIQPTGVISERKPEEWWNEISIVHYPSIRHFCDMLAGEDYQEVNRKYRLGALKDTFLLCTTEFDVEGEAAKL